MADPNFVYFWSPWSPIIILGLLFGTGCLVAAVYKRDRLIAEQGKTKFAILLLCGVVFLVGGLYLAVSRLLRQAGPKLEISQSFNCGWLRPVPWRSFADIRKSSTGMFPETVKLELHIDRRYIQEFQWSDWVSNSARIDCEISNLTDNPRSLRLPTDTDVIYRQVITAWQTPRNP